MPVIRTELQERLFQDSLNLTLHTFSFVTSLRGFLSFFSFTTLTFLAFFFLAESSSLSSPSSLLSLAEALLSYLLDAGEEKKKKEKR